MNNANDSHLSPTPLELIDQARTEHRGSLMAAARKIQRSGRADDVQKSKFLRKLGRSIDQVHKKSQTLISPEKRGDLPVSKRWQEIAETIQTHQVTIVCGQTGSGKTTKIPQICLDLKLGARGKIAHTQPRRIAARSVAARIADELKVQLGAEVGYKVRFDERHGDRTDVLLLTDGMLLAEIARDKFLNRYEVIIIDEAHERSLNIDFLLGYIRKILAVRTDLKVVITSATIDAERFSSHFNQAPIINVEGETYPIDIIYKEADESADLPRAIVSAVSELDDYHYGDTLVFLPTERDIRDTADELRKQELPNTQILGLYARQSKKLQRSIFNPSAKRRIILATNVAETSITVPRILNVIDSGLARISRYSYRSKIQRLPIEKISKASAVQRSGRCGRIDEGVCIRLYSEEDFKLREDYTAPEILRTSLAAVILKMQTLGFGKIDDFPFIDPPQNKMINDGYKLLFELKAINEKGHISALGKKMAQLPVDPRFACVLLHAAEKKLLPFVLPIVSALAIGDIKERPDDAKQKSDQRQRLFMHGKSDLLWFDILFNQLWPEYLKSKNRARKFAQLHFLSIARTREWLSLYEQLAGQLNVSPVIDKPAHYLETLNKNYQDIHCCLASGFLDYIGQFDTQNKDYAGTRSKRFSIFPGSYLFKKNPPQIMAIEMVESSKVYARQVAAINLNWLEPMSTHLYKTVESEPKWMKSSGNVMVRQTVFLYGLPILSGRLIPYNLTDTKASRRIFIEQALVTNNITTRVRAVAGNREIYERLLQLEEKSRSRNIVIDEVEFAELYSKNLPGNVFSTATFEKWYFATQDQSILHFSQEDFLLDHTQVDSDKYPEFIEIGSRRFPITYEFNPGSKRDGISAYIKSSALNSIDPQEFEYLIPAMLREKIEAILRTLPKRYRKKLHPVSEYARSIHRQINPAGQREGLLIEICKQLNKQTSLEIRPDTFELDNLDDHYKMNFVVTDESGSDIDEGRDFMLLQNKYSESASRSFCELTQSLFSDVYHDDFPEHIPKEYSLNDHSVIGYPAFTQTQTAHQRKGPDNKPYQIRLHDNQQAAISEHEAGTLLFIKSRLTKEFKGLRKNLPHYKDLALQYQTLGGNTQFSDVLVNAIILSTGLSGELPYSKLQMENAIDTTRSEFFRRAGNISTSVRDILADFKEITSSLQTGRHHCQDISSQLARLIYPDFITDTDVRRLKDLVRYTAAIKVRLEKSVLDPNRDQRWQQQVTPYCSILDELAQGQRINRKSCEKIQALAYMIEEYRVSIFAQNEIKTACKVSAKRLDSLIREIKDQY